MRNRVSRRYSLVVRTPQISLLIRTLAVLKGSTTAAATTSASPAAAIFPFALPVAIRRISAAAGAFVVSHWRGNRLVGSLAHVDMR
jgi:H+/gluconate symporter-like permease